MRARLLLLSLPRPLPVLPALQAEPSVPASMLLPSCPGRALSTPRVLPHVFELGVTVEASRGKTGVGTDPALPRFCLLLPSRQLLFGAQTTYSSNLIVIASHCL